MKVRNGFVSNSSSSSFVVIGNGIPDKDDIEFYENRDIYEAGWEGETEFGWDTTTWTSMHDRINYAYLQASYCNKTQMVENAIMEVLNVKEVGTDHITGGYIDHQSVGGSNFKIFKDETTLKKFLFADDSYIQGGNDNG